jgi:hypothetical protein
MSHLQQKNPLPQQKVGVTQQKNPLPQQKVGVTQLISSELSAISINKTII